MQSAAGLVLGRSDRLSAIFQPFITAVITLDDHDLGTAYRAVVMHKSPEDRNMHQELGFYDGWGTVTAQLAALVEAGRA